jgi:hypothetical protein
MIMPMKVDTDDPEIMCSSRIKLFKVLVKRISQRCSSFGTPDEIW